MRRGLHVSVLLIFVSVALYSQGVISGVVTSSDDSKPIPNAHILLLNPADKSIIAYTFSDENGLFNLDSGVNKENAEFIVEVSFIGFQKYSALYKAIPPDKLRIILRSEPFEIRSAVIKAPKVSMRGDTLNYMTSGFVKEQDRNIGEVLKRIPGVVVDVSGQIKYNDKPINAFYIDGKNMLEGQYGIATNNIRPDLVTMIQVFENHQPVRALKEHQYSENAAINLTIHPDARARFVGTADIGAGVYPAMWNFRSSLFRFSKTSQTMTILKSNKAGIDIATDLRLHSMGPDSQLQQPDLSAQNILNMAESSSAPVKSDRTLFNTSHLASVNLLIPLAKDIQATLRVGYLNDKKTADNLQTTRFIIDGENDIVLIERGSSSRHENVPGMDFTVTSNKEKIYVQNRLYGRVSLSDVSGNLTGVNSINQDLSQNQYDFAEIFNLIKPLKNSVLRFNSRTQYRSLPEELNIVSDSIRQTVGLTQIKSNNIISTQIKLGWFRPEITAGYNVSSQHLKSELSDVRKNVILSGENDMKLYSSELFITPTFRYDRDKFRLVIRSPLKMLGYNLKNVRGASDTSSLFFRISPAVTATFIPSGNWEGNLSYSFGQTTQGEVQSMNPSFIMNNYRTLSEGYAGIIESKSHSSAVRIIYRNALKLFSAGFYVSYIHRSGGTKSAVQYTDIFSIRQLLPDNDNFNKMLSFRGNISKVFFDSPLNLGLSISHSVSSGNYVQQSKNVEISSRTWVAEPAVSYSFGSAVNTEFNLKIVRTNRVDNQGSQSSLFSSGASLLNFIRLSGKMDMILNIEHYLNKSFGQTLHSNFFADIKVNYRAGKSNFELSLRNIFNNNQFTHSVFSELTRIEKVYTLRPRSLMVTYSFGF
ncbi:MAG: carboxypeptidase-like regulatory domain-containing protein [Bacteroidales bacterium]